MKIINKYLIRVLALGIIGLFLIASGYASTDNQRMDIVFNDQTMSADLENVTLRQILEKIKSEKGMWFTGNEPVLEERVSVQFKNSPMQEALQRILFDINHVLFFDNDEKLVGVIILGKDEAGGSISLPAITSDGPGLSSKTEKEHRSSNDPVESLSSGSPNILPSSEAFKQATTQTVGEDASEGVQPLDNPFAKPLDNPFAKPSDNPFAKPLDKEAPLPTGNPFEQKTDAGF